MDKNRAMSIINSPETIKVFYQGNSVWIDKVENDSAQVRLMDSQEQIMVPVSMLVEKV